MKTFKIYFLSLSIITISTTFGQIKKIDSLHKLFVKNQNSNLQKAYQYANESLLLSKEFKNDSLFLKSNSYLIETLLKRRATYKAIEKALKNKILAEKLKNWQFLSLSHLYLGESYRRLSHFDKSLQELEKGLHIAKKENLLNIEHRLLNSKAVLLKKVQNYKDSKKLLIDLLKNRNLNKTEFAYACNSLAGIYFRQEKKKDSGAYFYKKGIDLAHITNNDYLKIIISTNYSDLLIDKGQYKLALEYLKKVKRIAYDIHDYTGSFFINSSIATFHHNKKDYKKAIQFYKIALNDYGKYADRNQIADLYWQLSGALYNNGQYEEGFAYQDNLIYLKDSLFDIEKNKAFEELQTKFEVEKKNNQIAFLEKEQLLKAKEQKLVYSIGGLVFLGLVLVVFIFRYRIKSQKLIRKQEQQLFTNEKEKLEQEKELQSTKAYIDGQEKEKNRIALELHDGIVGDLVGLQHFVNTPNFETNTTYQEKTKEKLTQIAGEVRYLSHSLSSNYIDNTSFTTLIYKLVQPFINAKNLNISIHFFEEKDFEHLKNNLKNNLYRIIQQLLNNSIKHANANELNLSFTAHEDYYNIIFEDNGIGFDLEQQKFGIGLLNIEKRVQDLNGSLQIDTQPNKGTTIVIDIIRNE